MSIVVLTTGGTIASGSWDGPAVAPGARGLHSLRAGLADDVEVREVMAVDSSSLDLAAMVSIRAAVDEALDDPAVQGVVVLHGTDTLEETALLLDLYHDDPRPVAVTGAMRPADHPAPDGPHNLAHAVDLVRAGAGQGVFVAFAGQVLPAHGVRKAHTADIAAFEYVSVPRVGPLPFRRSIADVRVDIVALYPGADRALLDAAVAAGARGLVLEGMGSGNGNPAVREAVAEYVAAGVSVVLTTRVPYGPVEAVYGGSGGAHDLVEVGAVVSRWLRAGQARVLLAAVIADAADPGGTDRVRLTEAFGASGRPTVET